MIEYAGLAELFTYQCRPFALARDASDGGFKLSLFGDHRVVYTTYNQAQIPLGTSVFHVGPEVLERYWSMFQYEDWWLRAQPLQVQAVGVPGYTAMIGVTGHPMFTVDDLERAVLLPFHDERGLLARRMYVMLENVSSLLLPYGLYLTPSSFRWDQQPVTGGWTAVS